LPAAFLVCLAGDGVKVRDENVSNRDGDGGSAALRGVDSNVKGRRDSKLASLTGEVVASDHSPVCAGVREQAESGVSSSLAMSRSTFSSWLAPFRWLGAFLAGEMAQRQR
jgi:hypothetical protein